MDAPDLATRTLVEIRTARAQGHVALGSFKQGVLDVARAEAPEIPTGASTDEVRNLLWRSRFWATVRRPPFRLLQVPEVRAGLAVQVWTVDREDDMRRLLEWGVDAIITDRPDLAVKAAKAWNEHGMITEGTRKGLNRSPKS